jgi:hypothetical protein
LLAPDPLKISPRTLSGFETKLSEFETLPKSDSVEEIGF